MYKESNIRSIIKGFSWRILGTITTIIIVYLFFGRLDLAVVAGAIEWISKIGLYWLHERIWLRIRWGRKKIEPFSLWFTGLSMSGKTTIANKVYDELKKLDIPIERLDSKDIRDLIPNIGFTKDERNSHISRVGHLIKTLQNNSISTVSSFISPYEESRNSIDKMVQNNIIVYVKCNIETCKKRDYNGLYERALNGEIKNFTGINDIYEEPINPKIVIDTDQLSVDESAELIIKYIKKNYIK